MSDDGVRKLQDLQRRLETAQKAPPQLANTKRSVPAPTALRPSRDSHGTRRPVMRGMGQARDAQVERVKREMLDLAERELSAKAKEQLKP